MKEGWEYKKLGEVCDIERGGSPRPISDYITDAENGINWIKIGDAVEGSRYIMSTAEKIKPEGMKKSRFVHKGDFILSNSMSFGKPYILGVDGCIHDGWLVIHDDSNTFNKDFLYYYLGSPTIYSEFKRLAVGGVVNNLNSNLVRGVRVAVPPLSEQQHIVEELDLLSSIIEKKKAQIKELDNLAQSLFYEMFGDPIINNMEWEVKTLKELVYIGLGFTHTPQYVEKGVPFISVKDISSGYIDLSKIKYVSKEEYDNAPKGAKPQKGDLMFCRVGTMGKPLIVETDMQFCTFVSVGYMRRLQNNIDMSFLKYWMLSNSFDKQVEANVRGLAIKNLNTGWLKNFSIYLPPLSIQQQFASKIEVIEHQKELIKQSIKEVETLFNSRMDYYFN